MNVGEEDMTSTHIDASDSIASEYTQQGSPGELSTVTGEFSACPSSTGRLQQLSRVGLFATLWIVAVQASVHGIFRARTLEWVAISSSSPINC